MQKFLRSLALLLCLALLCGALAEAPGLLSEGVDMEVSKQSETVAMNEEDKSPAAAESSVTPESSATPEPSASAESSATPEPSATAESSATPEPSITPEPSATPEPAVIEPAQEKLVLGVGEKRSVADWRFISGGSGFDGSATYKSSNKRIATVDADGMVKALRNGKAVISVQAAGAVCEIQLEVKNAPKSVSLKVEKNVLGVGEETKLTVTTPKGTTSTWTVESADEGVAAIDGDTLRAVGEGSVKITARTHNGKTSTQTVTVRPAPDSVSFGRTELTMGAGEAYTLKASLNEGSAGAMRYSAAGDCISVDASGRVTALSAGEGTVTVETYNGKTAVCHVTVNPAPTQLALSTADGRDKYGVGEKVQLIFEADSPIAGVTYKSNNTRAAAVSADGVLTMKKAGKVTITASTYNGISAKLTIQVQNAPRSVTLKVEKNVLGVGEETKLTVTTPKGTTSTWTVESADEGVAAIDGDTLRAVGEGSVKITARTHNGKTSTQTVTVRPAPDSVSFDRTELAMGAGEAYILKASLNEGSAGAMYYSAAGDCISVDASGRVTALSAGEGTVTVETYNGKTAVCHVTVNPAPTQLALSTADGRDKYGVGEKVQLIFEADSPIAGVTYKSNNTRAAVVSADGVLTMKKAGKVTITATTYNKVTAKLTIQVQIAPKSVSLKAEKNVLGVGEEAKLAVTLPKGATSTWTVESADEGVAAIDGDTLRAVGEGSVKITARTHNGKTNTKTVTVRPAPDSVSFNRTELTMGAGEAYALKASLNEGSAGAMRYSAAGDCISVDASGRITALSAGEGTVTVETYNGKTALCHVTVNPAPTQLTLSTADGRDKYGVGEKVQLVFEADSPIAGVTYKSNNARTAAVSADGVLTMKKAGKVTITASAYNGISAKLTIQVQIAPKSVSLKVEKNVLGVGEEAKLTVTLPKGSAGRYEISLTGDSVRLEGDRIVAVRPGDTCVSVHSYNGRSAQVNITVCPEPTWLKLSPEEGAIPVGGRIRFAVEMDAGAKSALRFECSDSGVALPSEDGTILGVSVGEAWITVVTANGLSARALLRVCPLPERILLPALPEVAVGDKYQVVPETYPKNSMGEYTYASSDPSVARIDARGVISGYGAGSAVITVTSGSCVATQILTVRSYNDLHPVRVVAHRGASGYYPENTLDAFRHASDYGAKNVELDVRRTADGKLVVFHDASISVKGKSRRLDSMTYEQIKAVKPDICLLSEALQVIGECGLHAHVEIKDKNIEPEVAECVKQSPVYGDADYLCFDLNVLRTISAHDPDTELTYLINKQDKLNYLMKNLDKFQDIKTVSIHKALLTPEIVRTLHLHGKKVIGWTADTESDIKHLKKLGVDCITSNYPDRVK